MFRVLVAALTILTLAGCNDVAVKTFSDATGDVNEGYALGKQLRDRCNATKDVSDCKEWIDYKRAEEAENPLLDYDKGLARWEANGPY